ncbi:LysM peptidoglycan-binding domain-containing protein [Alicyclobacillus cycloheptanicus]|uniref:Nucleoid-associated protein YgaU n=1 Tax=Alicyclobacillus cycloheptanicus TaxID=1457 RepID=A0ABT9XG99_9BACL|nr:LysM domain-containing protein [Alicyclobacillus cycloheptanicus]MDQ0189325.1 nucleoid-associated protein YgaU [Alicyclobacillus cycloheptanicus]WDM01315.1 LysM peptidoglycan-binding domain-containing protein [Alicyclobacillus cycloheptanicus]
MYTLAQFQHGKRRLLQQESAQRQARRGKRRLMVLLALCWAIGASLAVHMWNGVASADSTSGSKYVVAPGDTLWSIATKYDAGQDPRSVMDEIMTLNHLSPSGAIQPGEVLVLPGH